MPHREGSGAHSKVGVHENVVRRSVNLEIGREEIEVLDAGELAVERFSKRPARNRSYQFSKRHYHDGRAGLSQHTTPATAHETSSVPAAGDGSPAQESRRRRALAAQGGVSRPSPVSFPSRPRKTPFVAPGR